MKKIIIYIIIVIAIVISAFTYLYFKSRTNNQETNNTNETINDANNTKGTPVEKKEEIFLLYVNEIMKEENEIIISGKVEMGSVKVGDEITIVGLEKKGLDSKIKKIENDNKEVESAEKNDEIKIVIESEVEDGYIVPGQAVIITGTTKPQFYTNAIIQSDSNLEEIAKNAKKFNINTNIDCSVEVVSQTGKEISIKLEKSIVVENDVEFTLKDKDNNVIAKGKIYNLI